MIPSPYQGRQTDLSGELSIHYYFSVSEDLNQATYNTLEKKGKEVGMTTASVEGWDRLRLIGRISIKRRATDDEIERKKEAKPRTAS